MEVISFFIKSRCKYNIVKQRLLEIIEETKLNVLKGSCIIQKYSNLNEERGLEKPWPPELLLID